MSVVVAQKQAMGWFPARDSCGSCDSEADPPRRSVIPKRRANDAGVDVKLAVADSTKLDGNTAAFDTIVDRGRSTHKTHAAIA
jgi:hypothetical protein